MWLKPKPSAIQRCNSISYNWIVSESCEAMAVPENVTTYTCDSNNDLQANFRLDPNNLSAVSAAFICKNGIWTIPTSPNSNGKLKKINLCHCICGSNASNSYSQ